MILEDTCIKPGDIIGFDLTITPIGGEETFVGNFMEFIHIFQDILSPFWTGQLKILDTANIITNLPIEIGSKLKIKWNTDFKKVEAPAEMEFIIYSISNRQFVNKHLTTYLIQFATEDFIIDKKIRIAEHLPSKKSDSSNFNLQREQSKKPEEIIEDLVGRFLGDSYLVETSDELSKIPYSINANNWSLYYTISQLTKLAIHEIDGKDASDYLFFRSAQTAFKFKSINELYKDTELNETGHKFRQMNSNLGSTDEIHSILKFKVDHFNAAKSATAGAENNQIISFDYTNLKLSFTDSNFDSSNKRKRSELFTSSDPTKNLSMTNSNIVFKPISSAGDSHISAEQNKWLADRKKRLLELEEDKLIIQIYGQSMIAGWIGMTCELEFPALQDHINDSDSDENYSGKYLITAIRHTITYNRYIINMALVKLNLEK